MRRGLDQPSRCFASAPRAAPPHHPLGRRTDQPLVPCTSCPPPGRRDGHAEPQSVGIHFVDGRRLSNGRMANPVMANWVLFRSWSACFSS